jgi:hypothetical protein
MDLQAAHTWRGAAWPPGAPRLVSSGSELVVLDGYLRVRTLRAPLAGLLGPEAPRIVASSTAPGAADPMCPPLASARRPSTGPVSRVQARVHVPAKSAPE